MELERQGYGIVVVEALVRYRKAAFFDDELTLRTELAEMSKVALRFEYAVSRGGEVLVTGHTRHACVELATGRPSRMPEQLRAAARDPS
jgi:acyl-CoA thioester hydrolase